MIKLLGGHNFHHSSETDLDRRTGAVTECCTSAAHDFLAVLIPGSEGGSKESHLIFSPKRERKEHEFD